MALLIYGLLASFLIFALEKYLEKGVGACAYAGGGACDGGVGACAAGTSASVGIGAGSKL